MAFPDGLSVKEHHPKQLLDPEVVVIYVHGSLDRGDSFLRTVRRLPTFFHVTYDRRGYQGSREAGIAASMAEHIDDLLAIADHASRFAPRIAVVGHSVGADIAIGAGIENPHLIGSVGAYEPPMPWLGVLSPPPRYEPGEPGEEVERFFKRMVGDQMWKRISEEQKESRRKDGSALIEDLRSIRGSAPFSLDTLRTPVLFGKGTLDLRHGTVVDWLVDHVSGAKRFVIDGAPHGAHLSYPDGFALFVEETVSLQLD